MVPLISLGLEHIQTVSLNYCSCFSVPSRGPSNLRLSNVQTGEVKVQWEPLPQQYANGRILGYSIYVYEYDYYVRYIKTVNSNSPGVHMVIVRGLKAAQRYRISVAAFTSKGVGPQSYYGYITTGNLLICLSRYTENTFLIYL